MSYDVQLYRKEVKEKQLTSQSEVFFENYENIIPFTPQQKEYLKNRLLQYNYEIENEDQEKIIFRCENEEDAEAMLTNLALYFSASSEGIFEICMTASEFTDTGEFVKYDPQSDGWEE